MLIWLEAREIKLFHQLLIDEHGGLHGIRDEGALESTLARPQNLLSYHPKTTTTSLAACYGFGFCQNHVFNDGNKRIALTAINVFLQLNGLNLIVSEAEAVHVIREVASGNLDEALLGEWIRKNSEPFELDDQ
jgi:death-on-curing protein